MCQNKLAYFYTKIFEFQLIRLYLRRKMRLTRYTTAAAVFLILLQLSFPAFGQPGTTLDLKKPQEYEERVLQSEKSDQKKFTVPRRFIQNNVTHYNYYFNANNKLNEVLERAKLAFKDDYSKLLPFYNYSLDITAADTTQLDSIISKSQSAIALHDLRNDWIDNMYLLWGASYFLQKQFDSAYLMFQYMNFAFAEKEKDGYYKTIGSSRDGNTAYSISTKEKRGFIRKVFTEPPSRNDAFIWQIRTFLEQDLFAEAASLIITLRDDPVFPKRLKNDLEEVQAYWFYRQNQWDSAAAHLSLALDNADTKQERARWEYLLAQLYELSNKYSEAENYYTKAIRHTTDPILDIYARLYIIRADKDGGDQKIDKNIAELLRMAKRDKYEEYRDIIYYMAAQMQLERNNIDAALPLLVKSTQFSSNNPSQRNKAFLQLAELSFAKKRYRQSFNFYDSIQLNDPGIKDPDAITSRKESLGRIANNLEIIERQDSLQRIAAMPEDERKAFVRQLAKKYRKQQGLKDEVFTSGSLGAFPSNTQGVTLFSNNNDTKGGDWYFYNTNSRSRGQVDFKSRWGTRPNVDNWRRSAVISMVKTPDSQLPPNRDGNTKDGLAAAAEGASTYDIFYSRLPLTAELVAASDDSIQKAMFVLGKAFIQDIEDCPSGIDTLESLRRRFPAFNPMDEVLFNLYYCYTKNGDAAKAAAIKKLMADNYGKSNFTTIVTTGKNPQSKTANPDATKTYDEIYDLFIEGNFAEAITRKKSADSIYSSNYWTPQLLYIEAVYYIKQKEDSTAKTVLNNIVSKFPKTPMADKATNLINVLNRRAQIEEELRNLVVNRPPEDARPKRNDDKLIVSPPPPRAIDTLAKQPAVKTPPVANNPKPTVPDTIATKPAQPQTAAPAFAFNANNPHYVVLILSKVDPVYMNEAKNAFFRYNRSTFYNKQFNIDLITIDADNRLMIIDPFKDAAEAVDYVDKTKPKTASEIIPWLKGGKYTYSVIDERNLELLKQNKNIEGYKTFLEKHIPGKFN